MRGSAPRTRGRGDPCTQYLNKSMQPPVYIENFLTGTKSRIFVLILGAGITPAQGSVKPTAGFTLNKVIYPSDKEQL